MKKKYALTGVMVIMSVILAYLHFVQARCNSDDAGTYIYMHNFFELGSKPLNIKTLLNPWFYCSAIAYLLNIGGSGTFSSLAYLSAWYGIAVFFTFLLMMHNRNAKWMIAMAVFILLPYRLTNKYHMPATIVTLFVIWALQCYWESRKRWIVCVIGLVSVYSLLFTDDRLLLILFLIFTLIVYVTIFLLQDKTKHKYLYKAVFGIILVAGVLKCVDITVLKITGQSTGITEVLGGYGGADYYNWTDIGTLVSKGIPSIFSALLVQWNIPVQGGMVQFNSLYWIIRILLAGMAYIALFSRWKEIIKKGIINMEPLDSLSVVCTTIVLGVNALNGMVQYYDLASAPINRYAGVCWFLLVVILARWLDEHIDERMVLHGISSNIFLSVIFSLLTIGYIDPVFAPTEDIANSSVEFEIAYLKEHGDTYKYGVGSYWISMPVTAATNAEYVISRGRIEDGALIGSSKDGFYSDGGNFFNFIVSDFNNEMTISPENVEEVRGDYVDIHSSGDTIYMYDYDVRFDTTVVMDTAGMGYDLTDTIKYHLDLPVGSSRIEVTTAAKDNLLLAVLENEDIADVEFGSKGDDIVTAEITCLQNAQIELAVGRKEDVPTVLYKVEIKRTAGAVMLDEGQMAFPLNEGRYIVTFSGENLKDMEVNWNIDGKVTQLTNGRIKRRYLVEVSRKQYVEYEIINDGSVVDSIYYENENLFDT